MTDFLALIAFLTMLILPCWVAMKTEIPTGADLGVRDLSEPRFEGSDERYIPG